MSIVPYRKRQRSGSYDMTPYSPMQVVPSYVPRPISSYGRYSSRNRVSSRRSGSYRDKFTIFNTHTSPVYPRPEVKFFDNTFGTLAAPTTIPATGAAIQCVNDVPEGTTPSTRTGQTIAAKSVYYQYVINFGATQTPTVVRHVLIWDRQSLGVVPTIAGVFSDTASLVTSPLNLQNRERFVVLADDRTTLSPNGDQIFFRSGFRKINQKAVFPTVTINIPSTGALSVIFISDNSVAGEEPTVYGTWRTRFMDC